MRIRVIIRKEIYLLALLLICGIQAALAVDWYVATNGTGLGTNGWANATNNFQGAIDKSAASDTIWVSNGVYATGGTNNWPSGTLLTNRIAITKVITVRSQNNDPTNTIIKGTWDPATNGPAAVRCVYMVANSKLIGFTLTNGATMVSANMYEFNNYGGGAYCPDNTPAISNCIITGNSAYFGGGGVYCGTLRNCALIGNTTVLYLFGGSPGGGGSYSANLYNCILTGNRTAYRGGGTFGGTATYCLLSNNTASGGGGAYQSTVINCILTGNNGGWCGGGTMYCSKVVNCLLAGNTTTPGSGGGGGDYQSTSLYNCTVAGNTSDGPGGGMNGGTLYNCIVYLNSGSASSNWSGSAFINTCTAPAATGAGNITGNPMFVNASGGNYRLSAASPCINAGTNGSWTTTYPTDLDARPRIRYGVVDMGAYENIRAGTLYGFR